MPARPRREPVVLQLAVLIYLAVLPLAQVATFPTWGVWITGADAALGVLLLVAAAETIRVRWGSSTRIWDDPGEVASMLPAAILLIFAAWVSLSGMWGNHPEYAYLKGLGVAALVMGTFAIGWSRLHWRTAVDAWLVGLAATLVLTWVPLLIGPEALRERLIYAGGMVDGLPAPRVSGPFLHPNMFGDYLAISSILLWSRWATWRAVAPKRSMALLWLLLTTMAFTVSSAWLSMGLIFAFIGLTNVRQRAGAAQISVRRPLPIVLVVGGLLLAIVTTASLLSPVQFSIGPVAVETGGIRPEIWESSVSAVREAPIGGVGASPYLAEAGDPRAPGVTALWDAHSLYLSILGQFGIVGLLLFGVPIVLIVRRVVWEGTSSIRIAVLVAMGAFAAHGVFTASEEFRHFWALLGIAVLVTSMGSMWQGTEPERERSQPAGG